MEVSKRERMSAVVVGVLLLLWAGLFATGAGPAAAAVGMDLDQCANGKPSAPEDCETSAWVNGNLNSNNSSYYEGDGVPFRFKLTGLTPGTQYEAVFEYDTIHGQAHAYDYIVSYDFTEATADPCTGFLAAATCTGGPATVAIDRDGTLDRGPGAADDIATPPGQVISVWNGSNLDFAYVGQGGHVVTGASEKKTSFKVTFDATATSALLAWAGHIADSADWAPEKTAIDISGSPYHMRLISVNGSGGNQDRSLKADAVLRHDAGSLAIDKSGPSTVAHGGTINYTFAVTYTPGPDGSPAKDVAVTDARCGGGAPAFTGGDTNSDGLLQGTETWTYSCSTTAPASHTAGEVDPIPNTAYVNGNDLDGDPLDEKSDDHSVDLVHGAGTLTVVKGGPASASHGETITYTFDVSYAPAADGSPAKNIVVSDPKCAGGVATRLAAPNSGDTNGDNLLQGSETWHYSCTYTVPAHSAGEVDPIPNTATVNGQDFDGDALTPDTDDHSVNITHDEGTLTIVKTGPATAAHGATVAYQLAVSYEPGADGSPAADIDVSDNKCAAAPAYVSGDDGDDLLEDGETWIYSCNVVMPAHAANESGSFVNVATVNGSDLDGDPLDPDSDDHTVTLTHTPGVLSIVKAADKTAVDHGGTVTYTFKVTYVPSADGAPAHDVEVTDPKCTSAVNGPTGDDGDSLLEAGETWTYSCTLSVGAHAAGEADPIENQATATGNDPDGDPITPAVSNKVLVDVRHAGKLAIDKSADKSTVVVGETVTYTYLVTNTEGDPIENVTVTDDKCSPVAFQAGDTDGDGRLDVGETWRYTCSQVVTQAGPLTNVAVAAGKDVLGVAVSATDAVTITVNRPVTVLGVQLPRTGSDVIEWALLGGSLVLLGFSFVFVSRRRREA